MRETTMNEYAAEILALVAELDQCAGMSRNVGLTTDAAQEIALRAEHIASRARMFVARREAAVEMARAIPGRPALDGRVATAGRGIA